MDTRLNNRSNAASEELEAPEPAYAQTHNPKYGLDLPPELKSQLRNRVHETWPDPLVLAKLINDDGEPLYLIDMHEDALRGTVLTCFDPSFNFGFPSIGINSLPATARLCPHFTPVHASVLLSRYGHLESF